MKHPNGMVLLIALVFLMVMSLIVTASLIIAQMSQKAAHAGQQQLYISQYALSSHIQHVASAESEGSDSYRQLASCPAQYAAWSGGKLNCELMFFKTKALSDNKRFYDSYSSVLIKQTLVLENE